eukprot:scaffold133972_cov17-Tisochrysis_lutea.AAC.1
MLKYDFWGMSYPAPKECCSIRSTFDKGERKACSSQVRLCAVKDSGQPIEGWILQLVCKLQAHSLLYTYKLARTKCPIETNNNLLIHCQG